MKPVVLIHINKLLPYSETFIKHHIDGVVNSTPLVLYSQEVEGLSVEARSVCSSNGRVPKLKEWAFKLGFLNSNLLEELRAYKPQLIHSHFGQIGFAAVPLSKKLGIPNITTFHGFDVTIKQPSIKTVGILHYLFRKHVDKLIDNGSLFIAVSEFIRKKLFELGFPENKIVVNYLGIDCNKFTPNPSISLEKKIVCVARHTRYKGIEYLIEAFNIFNKRLPGYRLKLIGDGELHDSLKKLADNYECDVEFAGRLNQSEVIKELQSASLYVQPSVRLDNGHEEALALTIVEAQSCAVPAVVFNSGGMPEAISPGISGLIAKSADSFDLAEKMVTILENDSIRDSMSIEARRFVCENHNHTKQTAKLENIYESLLEKGANTL